MPEIPLYREKEKFSRSQSGGPTSGDISRMTHKIGDVVLLDIGKHRPNGKYSKEEAYCVCKYETFAEMWNMCKATAFDEKYAKRRSALGRYSAYGNDFSDRGANKIKKSMFPGFVGNYLEAPKVKIDRSVSHLPNCKLLKSVRTCAYCQHPLQPVDGDFGEPSIRESFNTHETVWGLDISQKVGHHCTNCGWWLVEEESFHGHRGGRGGGGYTATAGIIQRFEISDAAIPIAELRAYLAASPKDLSAVDPGVFEKLMTDVFKDIYGPTEVIHVGGNRDRGIDIKIVKSSGVAVLVQVKRRSKLSKSEGVRVVRELNGVLLREGVANGMVVTTASKFTPEAKREAKNVLKLDKEYQRFSVDLVDFDQVSKLLRETAPTNYPPWR